MLGSLYSLRTSVKAEEKLLLFLMLLITIETFDLLCDRGSRVGTILAQAETHNVQMCFYLSYSNQNWQVGQSK